MFHKVWLTKHTIRFSYILATFQNKKIKALTVRDQKSLKLSFEKKKNRFSFFSGNISEISIVSLFVDVSKILWKKILDHVLDVCARR